MSSQARETYTPALTRCNTKKGTGAGLRRHEKTRPGSPSPNHKIKWPSPWSLQTPVYKSHLHSARVDPPCLKGVHLSPEVRSASGCRPRKARTEACLLPPSRRPLCERAPCWPFWPEAQGLCHVMACCNRALVSDSLAATTPAVCELFPCSSWSGAGTPQAAGQWLCSDVWRGVGDTLTTATARPQSLALSLSGSLFLSFFCFFSPTQDKPCSWALRLARPWESQLHSVGKSGSPNLRPYRDFGLSGLRNPLLFRHFALPGAWFSQHLFGTSWPI